MRSLSKSDSLTVFSSLLPTASWCIGQLLIKMPAVGLSGMDAVVSAVGVVLILCWPCYMLCKRLRS